ncbi:MAG TPA: kelch repeat-containing protein [Chitinophagaceae bacterium]|nr:kelch repeat-containing protein [Chitinophagaceae bacterium]
MRKIFLLLHFCFFAFFSKAQIGINTGTPWEFLKGDSAVPQSMPVYGVMGSESEGNNPGRARQNSVTWKDAEGNLWLFGGLKLGSPWNYFNDLWKYNPLTNQWVFMKGDNISNVKGSYGIRGVANDANKPGGRMGSVGWTDADGNLWLFGGHGFYSSEGYSGFEVGLLNDLWKYNPNTNQWTWIKGDNSIGSVFGNGFYGIKGFSAEANNPSGRGSSVSWKDASGNFWLFGGYGYTPISGSGHFQLNDLWKYNPLSNEWTWMKGDSLGDSYPVYGIQGVPASANTPGSKIPNSNWIDNAGNFWLFGGYESHYDTVTYSSEYGNTNDLWKYEPSTNNWTWMKGDTVFNSLPVYGIPGIGDLSNKPGSGGIGSETWKDASGNLWLFQLNSLWKYNPSNNQWTWMQGDTTVLVSGSNYGIKGVSDPANRPGGRSFPASWRDDAGNFWLFGDGDFSGNYKNDLWKFNPVNLQWTWMKGDSTNAFNIPAVFGTQGFTSEGNHPGAREGSVMWKDGTGNLWLFGGDADTTTGVNGYKNDLWKYNSTTGHWIWMKGDSTKDNTGVYGTINITASTNKPGSRFGSVSWTDGSGNLWLYGGYGYHATAQGYLNDLWKYEPVTNNWTWMKGDNSGQISGTYGTMGTENSANKPGARYSSITWTDGAGKCWLYGGYGYAAGSTAGLLNDLWKFDPLTNNWTWVNGNNTIDNTGSYGVMGTQAAGNKPGARYYSLSWADGSGNLWLFGGYGYHTSTADFLSDLWKYNIATNQWTWMKGNNTGSDNGVYGSFQSEASNNKPGARYAHLGWKDGAGNFWLFGGLGYGEASGGSLNDLWKYNPLTNNWTWMKGEKESDRTGIFGTKGIESIATTPGATRAGVAGTDATGNLILFGGAGYTSNGESLLNLQFMYNTSSNNWTWLKGIKNSSIQGVFSAQGISAPVNKPGAREGGATWSDPSNYLWLFGGKDQNDYLNDLWKYDQVSNQWIWMKGDSNKNSYTGVYGTLGIANSGNKPGARTGCISWTDNSGNLWLFGGMNIQGTITNHFNDLWKYDPVNNQWTWIKGDNTTNAFGVYGTVLIAAATNKPGAREGSVTWVDTSGNLWMYGGYGYRSTGSIGYLNDLWMYNPSTNQWTWMKGNDAVNTFGVYGIQGTSAALNKPGGRKYCVTWVDTSSNDLWLFGGFGYAVSGSGGYLNDLWKYNIASGEWTWMKGDSNTGNGGVYGSQGNGASGNKPGARDGSVSWRDVNNNFWLYGGYGYIGSTTGRMNDLWKYNSLTNQWTWVKGNSTLNTSGTSTMPGAREKSLSWVDGYGDLWLFGGQGKGTSGTGYLNDLWKIFGGTKYIFIGDGDWSNMYNWLNFTIAPTTITPGIYVVIDHQVPGVCVNQGPIVLQPLGKLKVEAQKLLTINQGGLSNAGSVIGVGNLPGKVLFTGTNIDSLRSTGIITTPLLLLDKKMYLTGNTTTSIVNLLGGAGSRSNATNSGTGSSLTLGDYNLVMDTASLITNSTNYIITNGTGRLVRRVENGSTVLFPVGVDEDSYTPATITNTGAADDFKVGVNQGVLSAGSTPAPVLTGNVKRTWSVEKETAGAGSVNLTFQWRLADEQPGFNRATSYIAHKLSCPPPPPPNCDATYYDAVATTAATGNDPYIQFRAGVTSFNTPSFIVTSQEVVYRFINVYGNTPGDGNWSNPLNWTNAQAPPSIIRPGMSVIIDPLIGNECIFTGPLIVQPGGKITVSEGKKLTILSQ